MKYKKDQVKRDVKQDVTDKILEALAKGIVPWQKPWTASGLHRNVKTKKSYQGINQLLLSLSPFASPYWLSYKQAVELGGSVVKGQKGTMVIFWKPFLSANGIDKDGKQKNKLNFFLRASTIFNIEQCENLKLPKWITDPKVPEPFNPIEKAESIVSGFVNAPPIIHGGDRACYIPSQDKIKMPPKESFSSPEYYYKTLFHEMTHSTGHTSRLNRKEVMGIGFDHFFGSENYANEELTAEMGAAMLSGHAGFEDKIVQNSANYLASWMKRIKEDKNLVVYAAAKAGKAFDHIVGKEVIEIDSEEGAQNIDPEQEIKE